MASSHTDNKKSRDERDFATEIVIDSTAPLEKLLRSLLEREYFSKAYKFYRLLLVQRRHLQIFCHNYHYALPGHPLKVFEKDWDGQISPDYFEPFPYRSTMPKVITLMRNIQKTDPVTDYLKGKSDWKHEMFAMKRVCAKATKYVRRLNDDVMQVPKWLIEFAALMEKDPDPNLDSTYNWYYAGNGNLQMVCVNWVDYLLHSEFSVLYLTRIHRDNAISIENEPATSFDCETENILETICSPQNIVALRTKHKIIFLIIIENDNDVNFVKLKQFESKIPFTSISFDKYHTNILYTTTLDGNLKIVNVDRIKARSVKLNRQSTTNVNNWNCVIGGDRATYGHIEGRAITFYDKRTNGVINSWTGLRQITDEVHCNDISAAVRCDDSPALYFASDHHAFLMDMRCAGNTRQRPLMRWTHGLRCAPTYMTVGRVENNRELVVIASQWCEDTCVVSNYAGCSARASLVPGLSVPYHAPGALDVLAAARLRMLCFDLASPIDGRLVTAVTGQALFDYGDNSVLLTHNSLGDITMRTLYPQYMDTFVEDDSVQRLHKWSQAYRLEKPPLEVSHVADIRNVWNKLRRVPDSFELVPGNDGVPFDAESALDAFAAELLPELLDAWSAGEPDTRPEDDNDESFALHLHYDDSV